MRRTFALASTALVALMAFSTDPADARVTKKSRGVEYFSDQAWNNQLNDEPMAEFPLGCRVNDCDFTVWLTFVPPSQVDGKCINRPQTPWRDCEGYPQCVLWIEFGDAILPLRSFHGRDGAGDQRDFFQWITAPINHYTNGSTVIVAGDTGPSYIGRRYEVLTILGFEVEVIGDDTDLCRAGLAAQYHPSSKTVFENGYLLPR